VAVSPGLLAELTPSPRRGRPHWRCGFKSLLGNDVSAHPRPPGELLHLATDDGAQSDLCDPCIRRRFFGAAETAATKRSVAWVDDLRFAAHARLFPARLRLVAGEAVGVLFYLCGGTRYFEFRRRPTTFVHDRWAMACRFISFISCGSCLNRWHPRGLNYLTSWHWSVRSGSGMAVASWLSPRDRDGRARAE